MVTNIYKTKEDTVTTDISGGREHYSYRLPIRAITTYEHETVFSENFHTLSAIIFGTDEYWWVLSDINKPIDSFDIKVSDKLLLPDSLVKSMDNSKKIF